MWNYIIPIVIIAALVAFVLINRAVKKRNDVKDAWKLPTETRARRRIAEGGAVVHLGRNLFYEAGLTHSNGLGDAFDRGIVHSDEKAACAGYPVERNTFPTTAVVFKGELSESGYPAFRVPIDPSNPYYNSEWDKMRGTAQGEMHYILAAGQTIASGMPDGFICILPYCGPEHENYFATVAEYEREHDNLAAFDGPRYEETKYHQTGGHPLIAECSGGFAPINDSFFAASRGFDGCVLVVK